MTYTMPENMVAVHINEEGFRDENSPLTEFFYLENVPSQKSMFAPNEENTPSDTIKDQLL